MTVAIPWPPPMHSVTSGRCSIPALELVEHGPEEHRARGAERMTEGDGAAVHVHPRGIDAELANRLQHHRGERLVDLPEVDVRAVMPASLSAFCDAGAGAVSMITGSAPMVAIARIFARGFSPSSLT